jgi:hypothetical protein
VLEALAAGGQRAVRQVGLGEPGFRPRFEGDPFCLAREGDGALERRSGIVELSAQEMGATDERERERSLLAAAGAFCQLDRTPQVSEGPLVGARVGGGQAARASDRTPASKLPALIAERPVSSRARAACFPAAPAAATGAGGLASAARKTAVPGALPCSARKSSKKAETCRFAASRSPDSAWLRMSSS